MEEQNVQTVNELADKNAELAEIYLAKDGKVQSTMQKLMLDHH